MSGAEPCTASRSPGQVKNQGRLTPEILLQIAQNLDFLVTTLPPDGDILRNGPFG
jgi:hypothetical protein